MCCVNLTHEYFKNELPDIYGQIHPCETPDLVQMKLAEFTKELDKIPNKKKSNAIIAHEICPEIVSDNFKLMFLRCEVFNAKPAVKRYVSYWDKRVEIFGRDRAFKPLTLENMNEDEVIAGKLGYVSYIEATKNDDDRGIFVVQPGNLDKTKYQDPVIMLRILCYLIHVALEESILSQKKGMIFLYCPRNSTLSNYDIVLDKHMMHCIQGCIPVRISAVHVCHPTPVFKVLWPVLSMFLTKRLAKRVHMHSGTNQKVLQTLKNEFKINPFDIPTILGGYRYVDSESWYNRRYETEKIRLRM